MSVEVFGDMVGYIQKLRKAYADGDLKKADYMDDGIIYGTMDTTKLVNPSFKDLKSLNRLKLPEDAYGRYKSHILSKLREFGSADDTNNKISHHLHAYTHFLRELLDMPVVFDNILVSQEHSKYGDISPLFEDVTHYTEIHHTTPDAIVVKTHIHHNTIGIQYVHSTMMTRMPDGVHIVTTGINAYSNNDKEISLINILTRDVGMIGNGKGEIIKLQYKLINDEDIRDEFVSTNSVAVAIYIETLKKIIDKRVIYRKRHNKRITQSGSTGDANMKHRKEYTVEELSTKIVYTDDTVKYDPPTRENERHVDAWGVDGHWRTYKSGKRIWIAPFDKGDKAKDKKPKIIIL